MILFIRGGGIDSCPHVFWEDSNEDCLLGDREDCTGRD